MAASPRCCEAWASACRAASLFEAARPDDRAPSHFGQFAYNNALLRSPCPRENRGSRFQKVSTHMVSIRLARTGAKNRPFYHIVVTNSRSERGGRFIERIGFFNPVSQGAETTLQLDAERVKYWLSRGAQPSDRVDQLIKSQPQASQRRDAPPRVSCMTSRAQRVENNKQKTGKNKEHGWMKIYSLSDPREAILRHRVWF